MGALLVMALLLSCRVTAPEVAPGGKTVLETFDYRGVTLDGGRFRELLEEVRAHYLRVPNDDLLKPYRQRAGKPAPGVDLKGVYIGHGMFGQFLSGLARLAAATGDTACIEKARALMEGWAECIEADGYALQARKLDILPYHFEKLVCGLVDMLVYGGEPRAATHLERIVRWAEANLAGVESNVSAADNWYVLNGEWYTLSENLYRAYLATRDVRCLRLAERFEYHDFWDRVARGEGVFERPGWRGWYHAYSHVNSFCGAGAAYRVKGDPRYLRILQAAYDFLQKTQVYATGGYGPNETLVPPGQLPASLMDSVNHFETQCGTWAAFKLAKYLIQYTGDARYGDWMERLALNGSGASIPSDAEGRVFYYSDYHLGGACKSLVPDAWPCCSGTKLQLTADYHDSVFFRDADALYVNLFAPATVEWKHRGARVRVSQRTRFPEEDSIELIVTLARPRELALAFRSPGWLAGPLRAEVNGQPIEASAGPDHWVRVRRRWSNGDRLRVRLPMALGLSRIDTSKPWPAAITIGPVVLAVRSPAGNPSRSIDTRDLATALEPVAGQPLNYRAGEDGALLVRSFYQFAAGETYWMYLDPERNAVRKSWEGVRFSAGWADFVRWRTTTAPGATVEYSFEGAGVRVLGLEYDDAGRAQVHIDGREVGVIDEYGPVRGVPAHWDFGGLAPGPHTIRLTVLAEANPKSKGRYFNVAGFEPLPSP